jgi:2-keto-3-deoxy-L-rhamnonate aldolase RhmA
MTGKRGRLHDQLARREVLAGLLQEWPNPLLVELAGACGYDFLIVDGQHGVFSQREFVAGLKALVASKQVLAMVRLARHDVPTLRQCLELGADAIVVPRVSTPDEARALVRAMGADRETSLIVILESVPGATNAAEILAVEGVDGAFVGPINLSTDLNCPRNYAHPSYGEALARIERAAAAMGKVLGTVPNGGYPVEVLRPRGHRLFILGSDRGLLCEAMNARTAKIKAFGSRADERDGSHSPGDRPAHRTLVR